MAIALPDLCPIITRPLHWLPKRMHAGGLSLMLNHFLVEGLAGGDLDFLRDKLISIEVTDIGIEYRLRKDSEGFVAASGGENPDVRFAGDAYTFLLLVTQREDADTLFFQRRLHIQGDTATGLQLKNFLDALGESPLPAPASRALERFADLYGRYCGGLQRTGQQPNHG